MKGKIWIVIAALILSAGVGVLAGMLISNAIEDRNTQASTEDRDRNRERDARSRDEESEEKSAREADRYEPETSQAAQEMPAAVEEPAAEESLAAAPAAETENTKAHAAYREILTYIHDHPTEFVQGLTNDPTLEIQGNAYAVADISGDGIDELIVIFTNTFIAGMYARIYSWDPASTSTYDYAVSIGAYCAFFQGGYLMESAYHNQGPSIIWPYSVSKYDASTGEYVHQFSTGSVSKELDLSGTYYDASKDVDEDGVIYYIYPAGFDYASQEPEPLTQEAFTNYVNAYIPEESRISLELFNLTMEDINALE